MLYANEEHYTGWKHVQSQVQRGNASTQANRVCLEDKPSRVNELTANVSKCIQNTTLL